MLIFKVEIIRERAKELKISQERLAEACYVEPSTINRWMRNKTPLPAEILPAVAECLHCEITDFFVPEE